jgi:hypothetical protein
MRPVSRTPSRSALLGLLLLMAAACTGNGTVTATPSGASGATGRVLQLRTISELREQFNRDAGDVRLILLVSPT